MQLILFKEMGWLIQTLPLLFPKEFRWATLNIIEKISRSQEFFHKVAGFKCYGIKLLLLLYVLSDLGNIHFLSQPERMFERNELTSFESFSNNVRKNS